MNMSVCELIRVRKGNFTLELLLKRVLHDHAPGTQTSGSKPQQHSLYICIPNCDCTSEALLCSHNISISTLNLSGETLCQKLYFVYYRRPFRVFSCVINFHFKGKSTWNDVRQWGFEVAACLDGNRNK